jgi:hypothetical protein
LIRGTWKTTVYSCIAEKEVQNQLLLEALAEYSRTVSVHTHTHTHKEASLSLSLSISLQWRNGRTAWLQAIDQVYYTVDRSNFK